MGIARQVVARPLAARGPDAVAKADRAGPDGPYGRGSPRPILRSGVAKERHAAREPIHEGRRVARVHEVKDHRILDAGSDPAPQAYRSRPTLASSQARI